MSTNSNRHAWAGGGILTLAVLASPAGWAGASADGNTSAPAIVVAQASSAAPALQPGAPPNAYPAYQRGVRQAAAEGNEALRRYIWRTRMIYNYYYDDFAREG